MPYLGNTTTSFNVDSNNINNGSITTEKIAAGAVVNADVNDSASIAGTKISADFGAQDLIVDTNLLFVDASADRVGVGTSSPTSIFDVQVATSAGINFTTSGQNPIIDFFANSVESAGRIQGIEAFGGGRLQFATKTTGGTLTNRLIINESGNVGVGTTAPDAKLSVFGSAEGEVANFWTNDTSRKLRIVTGTASSIAGALITLKTDSTVGELAFGTAGSERLRIDSSGRVGIGTTSPGKRLEVSDGTVTGGLDPFGGGSAFTLGTSTNHSLRFDVNSDERARIDTNGRLLVGTTTYAGNGRLVAAGNTGGSAGTLDITWTGSRPTAANTDIGYIRWYVAENSSSNAHYASIYASSDGASSGTGDIPGRLVFSTTADGDSSPTERMRITQSGHLKITDNTQTLNSTAAHHEINYAGTSASLLLISRNANPFGYYYQSINADPNNTSNYVFRSLQNTGVNVYTIWSNGTVSARSDARYKKNIETTRDGYLEDLSQLRVVKYNWYNHEDNAPKELGLIAQEVEEIFPGLVLTEPAQDAEGNETGEVCKSIKYSVFTPMLVKALQEAHTRIEQLEVRLAALEAN